MRPNNGKYPKGYNWQGRDAKWFISNGPREVARRLRQQEELKLGATRSERRKARRQLKQQSEAANV